MMERTADWPKRVLVAQPHGFCAGVVRAVEGLNQIADDHPGQTVYSYHEVIHNTHVVREFKGRGVNFINSVDEAPPESVFVVSAHGASPEIFQQARERGLQIFDATCPLVTKTHQEIVNSDKTILYIGHHGHDESAGTMGYAPERTILISSEEDAETVLIDDPEKVHLVMQTTLSMSESSRIADILRRRFPDMTEPPKSDICYATTNRQAGITKMIDEGAEAIVVLGSATSSNSKRLKEVAEEAFDRTSNDNRSRVFFVDEAAELDPDLFKGYEVVGLTAGASAPEDKFIEVMDFFKRRGSQKFEVMVDDETRIKFRQIKKVN